MGNKHKQVNGVRRTRRQTDANIDDGGPALAQHCTNVLRRPYSQPRALQCRRVYTPEDNVCASACDVRIVCLTSILVNIEDADLACLPLNILMRIQCASITFVFKFSFGIVLSISHSYFSHMMSAAWLSWLYLAVRWVVSKWRQLVIIAYSISNDCMVIALTQWSLSQTDY